MTLKQPSPASATFLDKADAGFSQRCLAIILGASIFAAYPEVILGMAAFFFRDFGYFGYPLAFHHRNSFWRGEVPLWNPLNNCGLPFLAQWNTLVLYPGSLFYLFFPLSWSLSVYCLLHQFLAGLGMYGLARRWTGNGLAASVAGLAYAFNGLTLNCLMWPNNIAALGWIPWVVWCVELGWQRGGRWLIPAALVGAVQMLTGAPEIIFLTWLLLAVLAGRLWWQEKSLRLALIPRVLIVPGLVAALSAVQLLPFLELVSRSQRDEHYGDSYGSMPIWGWANLLVPMFNCFTKFFGVYAQFDQYWTSSYYSGVGVLLLAALATVGVRQERVRVLAAVTCLTLIFALGDQGYLYGWLRGLLPQLGFIRYPIKWVVLPVFCIPLLAACSVARVARSQPGSANGLGRTAGLLGLIFLAMIAGITWVAWRHPRLDGLWVTTWHSALTRAGFLVLALSAFLVLCRAKTPRSRTLAGICLLGLIVFDGLTHMPRQNPVVARSAFEPGLVKLDPQPVPGESRAMISPAAEARLHQFASTNAFDDYIVSRLALYVNCNLLDGIPKVDGTYSLYLREPNRIEESLLKASRDPDHELAPLLDFLGVTQITAPGEFYEWTHRPRALPMVTAGQRAVFADSNATFHAIADAAFAPAEVVYLPLDTKAFVSVTNRTEAKIIGRRFEANRAVIDVFAQQPSLLVMAQADYHLWRARVDDRAIPVLRANYAFQAVQMPAGLHEVTLQYEDNLFHAGAMISVLALGGCAAGWLGLWPRRFGGSSADQ